MAQISFPIFCLNKFETFFVGERRRRWAQEGVKNMKGHNFAQIKISSLSTLEQQSA